MQRWLLFAAISLPLMACAPDRDGDGHSGVTDCDDDNASVYIGADELCDGVDNNCDGRVDVDAIDGGTFFLDFDADGYGDPRFIETGCTAPEGYAEAGDDCDDADDRYHPGADESDCTDPEDYNCDGSSGFADEDGDGFAACEDCDDANARTNPNAFEICDDIDNDCNSKVDDNALDADTWFVDQDGDGHGNPESRLKACDAPKTYVSNDTDCDDGRGDVHPGASERCNERDDDCDGRIDDEAADATGWFMDLDRDGHGGSRIREYSCERPEHGFGIATDCDDLDPASHPGADELCDAKDNDCDGKTDESAVDAPTWYRDADRDGFGAAGSTTQDCTAPSGYVGDATDCDDARASVNPGAVERCDERDNDCDGTTDEPDAVDALTLYVDSDADGFGDPRYATPSCDELEGYALNDRDCNDLDDAINPDAEEICDDIDNDCDSKTDPAVELLGSDADCAASDCLAIKTARAGSTDGDYWIEDGDGAFEVECDMSTDGGGWTILTGELLDDRDYMAFSVEGGSGSADAGGSWTDVGAFSLVPENADSSCDGVAVRATATLPFEYEEWSGTWSAGGDYYAHSDDDVLTTGWGDVTLGDCGGHLKFGTDLDDQKDGGEWSYSWNYAGGTESWTWASETVSTTDQIRWEVMDNYEDETVEFYDIQIKVR